MTVRPLLFIVGPTAVGKSRVGMEVAKRVRGSIVSADSMQVYRGMDVGTAKPTRQDQDSIPHYLIDVRDPDQPFSVAEYQELARAAIEEIDRERRQPVIVGGSGLYVRAVLDEYRFPPAARNQVIRERLTMESRSIGVSAMHDRLRAIDPDAAGRIHENDLRRMVRALEYFEVTGEPITGARTTGSWQSDRVRMVFGLTMPRVALYRAIDRRVDEMIAGGLLDEVRWLVNRGYGRPTGAMQAVGYKELVGVVSGQGPLVDAVNLIKRNTRRLARRQYTWFKRDQRIVWIDVSGGHDDAVCRITRELETGS